MRLAWRPAQLMIVRAVGPGVRTAITSATSQAQNTDSRLRRVLDLGGALVEHSMQSIVMFTVGVLAANRLSATDFGVFSLVYASLTVAWGLWRALLVEPFFALTDQTERGAARRSFKSLMTLMVIVTWPVFGVAIGLGAAFDGVLGQSLFGLATAGLFIAAFDVVRSVLIAAGSPFEATAIGIVWMLALAAAIGYSQSRNAASLNALLLSFAGSTLVALAVGIWRVGEPNQVSIPWRKLITAGAPLAGSFLLVGASVHLASFLVAMVSTVEDAGGFRGVMLLAGPITTLTGGLRLGLLADAGRYTSRWGSRANWRQYLLRANAVVAAVGAVVALVTILLAFRLGSSLLGDSWVHAKGSVVPFIIGTWFTLFHLTCNCVLTVRSRFRSIFVTRVATTIPIVSFIAIGAGVDGARGASWGFMFAVLLTVPAWWYIAQHQAE